MTTSGNKIWEHLEVNSLQHEEIALMNQLLEILRVLLKCEDEIFSLPLHSVRSDFRLSGSVVSSPALIATKVQ